MPLPPWKPVGPSHALREQLEELFAELLHEPWSRSAAVDDWHPAIDIYETADAYYVEADLPGVRPGDLEVRLRGRWLTICGSRANRESRARGRGVYTERVHGTFCRTFILEHAVDSAAIELNANEGIYRIRLPKRR